MAVSSAVVADLLPPATAWDLHGIDVAEGNRPLPSVATMTSFAAKPTNAMSVRQQSNRRDIQQFQRHHARGDFRRVEGARSRARH